jgi:hypothetical protein
VTGVVLRYEGTVAGFRLALREIQKGAMRGDRLTDPVAVKRLQRRLRLAMVRDLTHQILSRKGGDAA